MRQLIISGFLVLFIGGCAAFTPYESDFTCPKTFNGKCVSATEAYKESIGQEDGGKPIEDLALEKDSESIEEIASLDLSSKPLTPPSEITYYNALIEEITGILKAPKTPLIKPPRVIRILILPYEGDQGELYMARHIYLVVDQAQWVLDNKLGQKPGEAMPHRQTNPLQ